MAPRLGRLLRMPPREMASRAAEAVHGLFERALAGRRPEPVAGPGALLGEFCARPFFAFDGSTDTSPAALGAAFSKMFPAGAERIVAAAEAVCAGRVRLYAQEVEIGAQPDWHRDWKTGGAYPRRFYRDVPWLPAGARVSSKRVLELNRQQFLVTLGQGYALTGREEFAARAVALIESWMDANPRFTGVNWKDALELGIRLLSWMCTLRLIAGSSTLDEPRAARILAWLEAQRGFIARHHSFYSSPNTHLLGEALGLFAAGLMVPSLGGARRDAAWAQKILAGELRRQVRGDGSHAEQSAYYHAYALEMYLLATLLGRQHGVTFVGDWMERLERMAEYQMAIARPDGMLARFGDDDGGRTLRLTSEDLYDARPLLAVAAVLFERGDFRHVAGDGPAAAEEVFWLLGPAEAGRYLRMTPREPARRSFHFPEAHLGVVRSGWGAGDAWVCCQAQPMGMLTAGHSHAALLAVEMCLAGRLLLADPGTGAYGDDPVMRGYFRGARAHNVAEVDGASWYRDAGTFLWIPSGDVSPLPAAESRGEMTLGYRATLGGGEMRHLRALRLEGPGEALITDRFEGGGGHQLRFRWQFPPGTRLRESGPGVFEVRAEAPAGACLLEMTLEGFTRPRSTVWEASADPVQGWFSPAYGHIVPGVTLEIEEPAEFPAGRATRLRVLSSAPRPGSAQGA